MLRPNAVEILEDDYNASDKSMDFAEWALDKAETDASFYSWLFPNADNIKDFGSGMSVNQVKVADQLMQDIQVIQDVRDNYWMDDGQ